MYDRTVRPIPELPMKGLGRRIETLIGITGWKMAKYRTSWKESIMSPLDVVWRPHLMMILWFEVSVCVSCSRGCTLISIFRQCYLALELESM